MFDRPNLPASPLGASLPNAPGPQRGRAQPELFPMNASARALITARGTMREDAAARGMRGERWQLAMEPRERLPGGPPGPRLCSGPFALEVSRRFAFSLHNSSGRPHSGRERPRVQEARRSLGWSRVDFDPSPAVCCVMRRTTDLSEFPSPPP